MKFRIAIVLIAAVTMLPRPSLAGTTELSIITTSRAPFNAKQTWALALGKLRNVQVRSGSDSRAEPNIKRSGTSIHITGVIDARNQLVVPGKRFSLRQVTALQRWIDEQKNVRPEAEASNDRFGLTKSQLEKVHEQLKAINLSTTKDKTVREVISDAAKMARLPLKFDLTASQSIAKTKVSDEWQGFTSGTVIAAALRPLELAMIPRAVNGKLELFVAKDSVAAENWPVGWKSELKPSKLIPKYYESLPIEVEKTPITDVTAAIEQRLETPIRYDRALFRVMEMHPESTLVSFKSDKATYVRVLKTSLFRAGIKQEIRVDERGKPFFWLTPNRLPKSVSR